MTSRSVVRPYVLCLHPWDCLCLVYAQMTAQRAALVPCDRASMDDPIDLAIMQLEELNRILSLANASASFMESFRTFLSVLMKPAQHGPGERRPGATPSLQIQPEQLGKFIGMCASPPRASSQTDDGQMRCR